MEIEFRAFVDDLKKTEKSLKSLGASFVEESHIVDYWFCDKDKHSFDEVKQDEPGSVGLRIRRSKGLVELNCKVLRKHKDHNAFDEFEVEISDFNTAKKMLESIGFKVFCIVDKKRRTFRINNCLINLEDINGFRPAVELEIMADKDIDRHKEFLMRLLEKLNVSERIEKSITYLFMKEFSFRND